MKPRPPERNFHRLIQYSAIFSFLILMVSIQTVTVQAEEFLIPEGNVTALIDAIIASNRNGAADTIILAPPPPGPPIAAGNVYTLSKSADARIPFDDTGFNGLPTISEGEIKIVGNGAIIQRDPSLGCTFDQDKNEEEFRIIHVSPNGKLTAENVTIQNGCAAVSVGRGSSGGGIFIQSGTLILTDVNILNNAASHGGGISMKSGRLEISQSAITNNVGGEGGSGGGISVVGSDSDTALAFIRNSTISGNTTTSYGGGINVGGSSFIQLTNVTITNNTADSRGVGSPQGGGIYISSNGADVNLRSSILAANLFPSSSPDCFGPITSTGSNLIGIVGTDSSCEIIDLHLTDIIGEDPMLLPLADNGGRTATHALSPDSPAINKGDCPPGSTDQRGEPRVIGPACDIGAYESDIEEQTPENQAPTVALSVEPQNPTTADVIRFTANASDPDDDDLTYEWSINDVAQPQLQGPTAQWDDPVPGTHTIRVVVSDGNGGVAEDIVTFTVVENPSVPEQPMSLAQALDTNDNGRLDDDEILRAIQFWIAGTVVPGADTTISDSDILSLIQLWISGAEI